MSKIPITLIQGADYPIDLFFVDGQPLPILSSVGGETPSFNFADPHSFSLGERVRILHSFSANSGVHDCGAVTASTPNQVTISLTQELGTLPNGAANGWIAKAANMKNYLLIGFVYLDSSVSLDLGGVTASVDVTSNQVLLRGLRLEEIRVGDFLTIQDTGINASRVRNLQDFRDIDGNLFHVAFTDTPARYSASDVAVKCDRKIISEFVSPHIGDGLCGRMSGVFKARDFEKIFDQNLFKRSKAKSSCSEPIKIGCYQILLAHGFKGREGYRPYYSDWLREVQVGDVFVKPSIGGAIAW